MKMIKILLKQLFLRPATNMFPAKYAPESATDFLKKVGDKEAMKKIVIEMNKDQQPVKTETTTTTTETQVKPVEPAVVSETTTTTTETKDPRERTITDIIEETR